MRLHCDTFGHWKDVLICGMSCPHTDRCKQFKKWREEGDNEQFLWQRIVDYMKAHPENSYHLILNPKVTQKKKESIVKRYICIREEDVEVLTEEQIKEKLLEGIKFDEIFEMGREMEVQIRLVPAKNKRSKREDVKDNASEEEDVEEERPAPTPRGRRKKVPPPSKN